MTEKNYGGFESQVKWEEHLVILGGCNDCHTPKKMTPTGPVPDESLTLSAIRQICHLLVLIAKKWKVKVLPLPTTLLHGLDRGAFPMRLI
jgi:hypothetical protein